MATPPCPECEHPQGTHNKSYGCQRKDCNCQWGTTARNATIDTPQIDMLSGQLPVFINHDHATAFANAVLRTDPSGTGTIDIRLSNEHVTAIMAMMADGYHIVGLSFIYVKKEM